MLLSMVPELHIIVMKADHPWGVDRNMIAGNTIAKRPLHLINIVQVQWFHHFTALE
jgi:hypothetical protein